MKRRGFLQLAGYVTAGVGAVAALVNLRVPRYRFVSATRVVIGEDPVA